MGKSIVPAHRGGAGPGLAVLAAGCAFGIAACMAGGLRGVVNLLSLYVLESTRGAPVGRWLQTWEGLPPWVLLVAFAGAALGSWTTAADRTHPDPRRSVLAFSILFLLALGGARLGGDSWVAIGFGALWQMILGWWLAARLCRLALDAQSARRQVLDPVRQAQETLLSAAGAGVIAWALASLAPVQLVDAGWLEAAAAGGMVVALACGVLYLSGLRQLMIESELEAAGVKIDPGFWRSPPRFLVAAVIAVVCLAALLPSDLSPLHIRDFNLWMEALTDRIGPLLVPAARVDRGGHDGIFARLADAASRALLAHARQTSAQGSLGTVARVVLLGVGVALVSRLFRQKPKPLKPSAAVGSMPYGFRWLMLEVRRALLRLLARFGWYENAGAAHVGGRGAAAAGLRRPRMRLSRLPSNVILIYLHVIDRLGERGLARRPSETPLEFLKRWRERSHAPDDRGLPALTRLFLAVRYGGSVQQDEMLQGARRAASAALRGWRRDALAARLRTWSRGRQRDEDR